MFGVFFNRCRRENGLFVGSGFAGKTDGKGNLKKSFSMIILYEKCFPVREMSMELILVVSLFLFGLLWMFFFSVWEKRSPFLSLAWMIAAVGVTAFVAFMLATVRAAYFGQAEWAQEKQFFLQLFIDKLEASGDWRGSAEAMQAPEVKETTRLCIRRIVDAFRPKTILYLSSGGVLLLLSAVSLRIERLRVRRWFPFLLLGCVVIGTAVFDVGVWYGQYAARTEYQMKNFLRLQQSFVMKELAKIEPDRSIPEIVLIIRREAGETKGYSYGQGLVDQLRPEKDKEKRR